MTQLNTYTQRVNAMIAAMSDRVLVLDGAMGTMIQQRDLVESHFRPL